MFQKSVVEKHIKNLNRNKVLSAYKDFKEHYQNEAKIKSIKKIKEESYQEGFLRDLFVEIFGYRINPNESYNLTTEYKNQVGAKKADGAILKDGDAVAVIELKSTKTKDFEKIREQAFNYKVHQKKSCKYVITSNFEKLRFYVEEPHEFEEFDLFHLEMPRFQELYLILHKDNLFSDIPFRLKEETKVHEKQISGRFYKSYAEFKQILFNNLTQNNTSREPLILFKKSQKFLDRLLFIFFAEDNGLLPPNIIHEIIADWHTLKELQVYQPLYDRFKLFFHHIDKGGKYKDHALPAYNGGLFAPDQVLDVVKIDDVVLENVAALFSVYDFSTDVDVNILGHIFEHSLSEIEEMSAKLKGESGDKKASKRKKDGVFYTPKYITQYIVENTIGVLCRQKKKELGIELFEIDDTFFKKSGGKSGVRPLSKRGVAFKKTLDAYKKWLLGLKILDPACGSGAFLNQSLNFLEDAHETISEIETALSGGQPSLFEIRKTVLENNLFGVDINDESVEIARLSLWLRTAEKGRPLSDLTQNIKCGNSLIDDSNVAGIKAFNWKNEFHKIMEGGGFDVVIGNPPYVRADSPGNDAEFRTAMMNSKKYLCLQGKWDLYIPFVELALDILKPGGKSSLIIPDAFCHAEYAKKCISWLTEMKYLRLIDYFPDQNVFENVGVKSIIVNCTKNSESKGFLARIHPSDAHYVETGRTDYPKSFRLDYSTSIISQKPIETALDQICYISKGIVGNSDEKHYQGEFKVADLITQTKDATHCRLYYEGKNIDRWTLKKQRWLEYGTSRSPEKWSRKVFPEFFDGPKVVTMRSPGRAPRSFMDTLSGYFNESAIGFKRWCDLAGVNNKSIQKSCRSQAERKKREALSTQYSLKALAAIMNSKLIAYELNSNRRSNIHVYPDDWKKIGIPEIPERELKRLDSVCDSIAESVSDFHEKISSFKNYIIVIHDTAQFPKKLSTWHSIDFNEFIKILNVAIKKTDIQKLSKSQEMDWFELFEEKKKQVQNVRGQIQEKENEMNQLVYSLYGLSKEEIAIVESD